MYTPSYMWISIKGIFKKYFFLSKKISLKNQVCVTNLIFWLIYLYAILHPKIQYLHQDPHLLIFNFFPKSLLFYLWILLPLFSSFHALCWEHQQMTPTFLQTKSVCMILSVSLITTLMMFISIFFSCFWVISSLSLVLICFFCNSDSAFLLFAEVLLVQWRCLFGNSIHTTCDFSVILFLHPIFHFWFHCEHFIQFPWRYKSVIQTLLVFSNVIFILNVIITPLLFPQKFEWAACYIFCLLAC